MSNERKTIREIIDTWRFKRKGAEFFDIRPLLDVEAEYYVIFGERSNGKTFSVLEYIIKEYFASGATAVYLRRWEEDIKGNNGSKLFENINADGYVKEWTGGQWDYVKCKNRKYYLAKTVEGKADKEIIDNVPFLESVALTEDEHKKGTQYPNCTTIFFDEFISRKGELINEFETFLNVISTIIRNRDNVKVIMCGNSVSKGTSYFSEMGLRGALKMTPGDVDVYKFPAGEHKSTRVLVHYSDSPKIAKPSDKYFGFKSGIGEMITKGGWNLACYPHCPMKYTRKDVVYTVYLNYRDELLQGEIIVKDGAAFLFWHRRTYPISSPDTDIIFSAVQSPQPNRIYDIMDSRNPTAAAVYDYFLRNQVYYQDNEVGEIVRDYLMFCSNIRTISA